MCEGTGLNVFEKEFPDRIYDVGIAEQHAVTFAAGLASQGMRPVVAMYATFLQRAYDQVVHDVATQNLPVTFCIDRGGLVAEDGTTHHGAFDYAYLRHIPNMVVMAPKDENELQHMLKTCVQYEGPASVRYPRGLSLGVHDGSGAEGFADRQRRIVARRHRCGDCRDRRARLAGGQGGGAA